MTDTNYTHKRFLQFLKDNNAYDEYFEKKPDRLTVDFIDKFILRPITWDSAMWVGLHDKWRDCPKSKLEAYLKGAEIAEKTNDLD
jgi:hypothetical protein